MGRSILIYANRQGDELKRTGDYMQCLAGVLSFKWLPLHLVSDADWDTLYDGAFFADVETVWEQVEAGEPTPHRERLHARIAGRCPVIRFPPYSGSFLWPFAGDDPRQAIDPNRYPWPDAVAAQLAGSGLSDDALFERYMRTTEERMPDLQQRLAADVARWTALDAIADLRLGAWVEARFRTTSLFHAPLRVTAPAIAHLMKLLLARTPILPSHLTQAAPAEVDLLLRFHAGQDLETVPIHPGVARRLDLTYYDPNATWRWHSHRWTFRQYMLRYIHWAEYIR
ncbi:MAG TPA: WcbI family polysaccharide biosynthesis putative acetyltransferase [Rhodopila sp.]|uniref:WcbI family polysaccharide biosynthesis putative acetyltransferase n=1 Tax=Rhodopila sp. TaxID=2480087 RepID=UPI002C6EC989|nr:WcbI family polysaccharide biosynthesis putative acetyltransferase [Rhodopila sp.]HVY15873.1 WcbI family polysaccharide biosynthesis putative acetyltransferase [Rhodopila sp.]